MSNPHHRHVAVWRKEQIIPFAECVNRHDCNPQAHGNITIVQTCRCGVTRHVNQAHNEREYGPWTDEPARAD